MLCNFCVHHLRGLREAFENGPIASANFDAVINEEAEVGDTWPA